MHFLLLIIASLFFASAASGEVITTGLELHRLSPKQAAQGLPARIQGTVTYAGKSVTGGIIVDDGVHGFFVSRNYRPTPQEEAAGLNLSSPVKMGDRVEIVGITGAGFFAPLLEARSLRVLGRSELPPAMEADVPLLLSGRFDCQRVKIQGVIQDIRPAKEPNQHLLSLATSSGRCTVFMSSFEPPPAGGLLDADVEVTGVCTTFFNPRRELAGVRIRINGSEDIRILRAGLADPFSAPKLEANNLRPYSMAGPWLHRQQLQGTVTVARRGEYFYLQAGDRGVRVETRDLADIAPGEVVTAAGFIETQQQFAGMRFAEIRRLGTQPMPAPLAISRRDAVGTFDGYVVRDALDLDGRLVSIAGTLVKADASPASSRLYLEMEGVLTMAELGAQSDLSRITALRPGSSLSLTGVLQSHLASTWPAQEYPRLTGFQLLLRSPADIVVTKAASYWTAKRLSAVLGGLIVAMALALGWIWLLRRRVEEHRQRLHREMQAREKGERAQQAAKVGFEATLKERERLAADLHDTLEQALTGVAFQLETMNRLRAEPNAGERSVRHLELARQMLGRSREEMRRSVWNLRAHALENHTLQEALIAMAETVLQGTAITLESDLGANPHALPDWIATNLLLFTKEALTNTIKHAAATTLRITGRFDESGTTLSVEDNGVGFETNHAAGPAEGHFGLQGMRERVRRIGGEIEIHSQPGQGTRITLRLPPLASSELSRPEQTPAALE